MTVDSGLAPREGTPYGPLPYLPRLPGSPDPKPERRIVNPKALSRFRETADGCQVCGEREDRSFMADAQGTFLSLSVHHIVPRSQGGDDVEENFAAVCGDGTRGCHGHLETRTNGARETLRERFSEAQVAYVVGKKGEAWLDRHYPLPGREDDSLQGLA